MLTKYHYINALKQLEIAQKTINDYRLQEKRKLIKDKPLMECPRKREQNFFSVYDLTKDYWTKNNTCSFCGSLHPDIFMEKIKAGVLIDTTNKNYKVYLGGPSNDKFYFQHLSKKQKEEFVELLNNNKLNIYNNHFEILPYFITKDKKR